MLGKVRVSADLLAPVNLCTCQTKKPRKLGFQGFFVFQLVPETGVEPATYALRMRRSTN